MFRFECDYGNSVVPLTNIRKLQVISFRTKMINKIWDTGKSIQMMDGQAVGYWQKFQREIIAAEIIASNLQIDLKLLECELCGRCPLIGKKTKSGGNKNISVRKC